MKEFSGSRAALGATVVIDDRPYVVVGIAPPNFSGAEEEPADVWLPIAAMGEQLGSDWESAWDAQWVNVVGRLAPGVSREAAGDELTRIFRAAYGGQDHPTARATLSLGSLDRSPRWVRSPEASVSLCVWGLTIVVLIIACTNVANLLLARDTSRATETAVRLALGASVAEVGRLVMLEAAILAAAGGVLACGVALLLTHVIQAFLLPDVGWPAGALDIRSLITGLAATACVLPIVGLVRLASARRLDVAAVLRAGGGRSGASRSHGQAALAASQCALLAILLVGSGLFVRSVRDARGVDYGIDANNIVVTSVEWPHLSSAEVEERTGTEWQRRLSILQRAADRLRADPAVAIATVSMGLPFSGSAAMPVTAGRASSLVRPSPQFFAIDSDYFKTVGTPLLEGRAFSTVDAATSGRVAIVSRELARRLWPAGSGLDQCLYAAASPTSCIRVIGIAADVRNFHGAPRAVYYLPIAQTPLRERLDLVLRPRNHTSVPAAKIRGVLLSLDEEIDFVDVRRLRQYVDPQIRPWELGSTMFAMMGALALLIAAVGVYGLVTSEAIARRREIGIRRALGAGPARILGLMLDVTARPVVLGLAIGLACAAALSRFVAHLLFEPRVEDPGVFGATTVVLLLVALIAAAIPAVRTSRIAPADALRTD